jgi:hypothetical protein
MVKELHKGSEIATVEFEPSAVFVGSSGEVIRDGLEPVAMISPRSGIGAAPFTDVADASLEEMSPVFRELALPQLPELPKANRAWLQMQTPGRLFFYWSLAGNPYKRLNSLIPDAGSAYTLAVRLVDIGREAEEIQAVEPEGSWWFNADPASRYRAEVGFYAPNRPFVRIVYSNTIETPRKSPSTRAATDSDWHVPAQKFAEVLDVAGFRQDAIDVAIAGDEPAVAEVSTYRAFSRLTGRPPSEFSGIDAEELRYVMLAMAAGSSLEQLRYRVSARLFSVLQSISGAATRSDAMDALKTEFDIDEIELFEEEEEVFGPAVFGASLVNFPQRSRRFNPAPRGFGRVSKFEPLASHSVL